MKIKTGIDIIEVNRVQEAIEKHGELFLRKVYSQEEIQHCQNTGKMQYQHYAVRFAAKEAVFKAISDFIDYSKEDIWKNIVIENSKSGKPFVKFSGTLDFLNVDETQRKADVKPEIEEIISKNRIKVISMDLSLSHIKEYAIANFTMLIDV